MAVIYLQGGDTYQKLDDPLWSGQTFRVIDSFTLQWIDLNLKLSGRRPEALCTLWHAGVDHLPTGNLLSPSSYWLINPPFAPTDWHWFEPWGLSLTENNPWEFLNPPPNITYSLKNGVITMTNPGEDDIGINFDLLVNWPLQDASSKNLHLSLDNPFATVDYLTTIIGLGGYFYHPGEGIMHFALYISLGPTYYEEGQYGVDPGPPFPRGWKYIGTGKHNIDLLALWQQWRTSLGESTDPTGWSISNFHFAFRTTSPSSVDTLKNDYLGWYYPSYSGAPPPSPTSGYSFPNRLYRVRFKMKEVLLNADSYYFIRVCVFTTILDAPHHWQYDKGDASYPGGIRLSSDDSGETWTTHFDDDHLFAVFGTPEVPSPPPEPPIDHFAILDVVQTLTDTGYRFVVTTNVPVHLYMFWTTQEPEKHPRTTIVRGVTTPSAVAYCFVQWNQNDQAEPGDTIVHTFVKEPWAVCETRWFTFRALVNNEWSPSVGPIFHKHRLGGPWTLIINEPWTVDAAPPDMTLIINEPWTT